MSEAHGTLAGYDPGAPLTMSFEGGPDERKVVASAKEWLDEPSPYSLSDDVRSLPDGRFEAAYRARRQEIEDGMGQHAASVYAHAVSESACFNFDGPTRVALFAIALKGERAALDAAWEARRGSFADSFVGFFGGQGTAVAMDRLVSPFGLSRATPSGLAALVDGFVERGETTLPSWVLSEETSDQDEWCFALVLRSLGDDDDFQPFQVENPSVPPLDAWVDYLPDPGDEWSTLSSEVLEVPGLTADLPNSALFALDTLNSRVVFGGYADFLGRRSLPPDTEPTRAHLHDDGDVVSLSFVARGKTFGPVKWRQSAFVPTPLRMVLGCPIVEHDALTAFPREFV